MKIKLLLGKIRVILFISHLGLKNLLGKLNSLSQVIRNFLILCLISSHPEEFSSFYFLSAFIPEYKGI